MILFFLIITSCEQFETVLCKINKTIGLTRKLQNLLPRTALITLYKVFARPHLDYGDIIYDQAHNASFHQKLESLQYKLVQLLLELYAVHQGRENVPRTRFESLQQRCWCRKLSSFYKVFKNESPRYLFNINPIRNPAYSTRNHVNIPLLKTDHNFFKNAFFPSTIIEWNNLDPNLRNSDTYGTNNHCLDVMVH